MKRLNFVFKGERQYITGADIFNSVIEEIIIEDTHSLVMNFYAFTKKQMDLLSFDEFKALKDVAKIAHISTNSNGKTDDYYLIESDEPVVSKNLYDEDIIIRNCKVEGKNIVANFAPSYSLIEQIVALNKHMLKTMFPEVKGKWIFTKIRISEFRNEKVDHIKLIFRRNLNFKHTETQIFLNNNDVSFGTINFALV